MSEKITYSEKNYQEDRARFEKSLQTKVDLAAFKRLMTFELACNTEWFSGRRFGIYSVADIENALANPSIGSWRILVYMSNYLRNTCPIYNRLILHYSKMGLFHYNIKPYDVKQNKIKDSIRFRNSYFDVCSFFSKMNFYHEMEKISDIVFTDDIFYGLIFDDTTDMFIIRLDPSICKIFQIQDGVFNYKINLAAINLLKITSFPDYIQRAYLDYQKNGLYPDGWYVPPIEKQVCLKLNESCLYPMPLFLGLFSDIFDLDAYKKLKLQKARVDNYKAIVIEVPIDKNTVDKQLITFENLMGFYDLNKEAVPSDIGYLHVPNELKTINFKDNANTANNVKEAVDNFYDNAGVSSELFNSDSAGTAFKLSLENDASIVYGFYRQVERFFTRLIKLRKYNKPDYKFALTIQNSTIYNRHDVSDAYLKASQNGLPYKLDYGVSLGSTPSQLMGVLYLENNVLELQNQFIPLVTSYTSTASDVQDGRPTNESKGEDLSVEGEIARDQETNLNR